MHPETFEFATEGRIIFGCGKVKELPELLKPFGKRVLLVTGAHPERHEKLKRLIEEAGLGVELQSVREEPTVERVNEIAEYIQRRQCDAVVGIGGGSVLDAGKAAAALANNPGELMDYLEGVGKGKALPCPSLPYIAVPTTAGTGSEVTKNAVIGVPEALVKVSFRSAYLLPKIALVDPELTLESPPEVAVNCAFDALSHLLEAYLSLKATPMTDAVCREGLSRLGGGVLMAYWMKPEHLTSRVQVSLASLLGGLALANGGLGAVHGFAGVLGGMIGAPHGAVCAALLAPVLKMNYSVARENPTKESQRLLGRISEVSLMLSRNVGARPEDGIEIIKKLAQAQNVAKLSKLGLKKEHFPTVVEKASKASSMKGNPFVLSAEKLTQILEEAF